MSYYVVEIVGVRSQTIHFQIEDLHEARDLAYDHSAHTGALVEVQNEQGRAIERIQVWRG